MRKLLAAVVVVVALVSPVTAEQSAEDAYAACLIGNAVVEMHSGADREEAAARAWATCESLDATVSDEEGEGISDFVYSVLEYVPDSNAPMDLKLGN